MDISPATIGAISAAVAMPIFMRLIRNVKSLQHSPSSQKDFEQLKTEYSKWEKLGSFLIIIFAAIIGYSIWKLLSTLAALGISYVEPSKYLISQPAITWALPALFLSIFLSAIPCHYLYLKLLGKERYSEYTEYGNQKFGVNSWKLFVYMAYVLIPICILFTFLSLNSYARVTEDSFVVNRFFSIGEKEYKFGDIDFVELTKSFKAPNGNIVRKQYYSIGFNDGSNYNFHKSLHDQNFQQQREIAEFISKSSNINVKVNDPYPR